MASSSCRLTNGRFLERLATVKRAARRGPPSPATVFVLEKKHSATLWIDYKQTSQRVEENLAHQTVTHDGPWSGLLNQAATVAQNPVCCWPLIHGQRGPTCATRLGKLAGGHAPGVSRKKPRRCSAVYGIKVRVARDPRCGRVVWPSTTANLLGHLVPQGGGRTHMPGGRHFESRASPADQGDCDFPQQFRRRVVPSSPGSL